MCLRVVEVKLPLNGTRSVPRPYLALYCRSVKKFTASGSFVSKVDVPGPLDTGDYCYQ